MKRHWLKISLIVVLGLILAAAFWVFRPDTYLPHKRIVLKTPYPLNDFPDGMIPMGEKTYHPDTPRGHPGIDFGWDSGESHAMVAAADGKVSSIKVGTSSPGKYDLEMRHGVYSLRYKEMEDTAGLKVGDEVKTGDVVGHAGRFCDNEGQNPHCWFNIHWELASVSLIRDRFCPVTYFDEASRASIEALWAKVPADNKIKSQYPDICSGGYKDKTD